MTHRHVQQLEQRRVRYGYHEPILVEGTAGADLVEISVHGDLTIVRIENANGVTEDRYGLVSGIAPSWFEVRTFAGDDTLRIHDPVQHVRFNAGDGDDSLDLSELDHRFSAVVSLNGVLSGGMLWVNHRGHVRDIRSLDVYVRFDSVEHLSLPDRNHELVMNLGAAPRSEFISVRVNLGSGSSRVHVYREPPPVAQFEPIRALLNSGTGLHSFTGDLSFLKIVAQAPTLRGSTTGARSIAKDILV